MLHQVTITTDSPEEVKPLLRAAIRNDLKVLSLSLWFAIAAACALLPASSSDSRQNPTPAPTVSGLASSPGQVYYVAANDPEAGDSNNGRYAESRGGEDGPWRTIKHAAKMVGPGDTLYVRAGTYYEAGIRFSYSGEPNAPITLRNYASEKVIIDGSRETSQSSGIEIVQGQSHFVIRGLEIRKMRRNGIMTDGTTNKPYLDITIQDCILHDNGLSGIRLAAVDGFVVENVQAHDNGYYGIDMHSSEDGALSAAHGVVRNSAFYNHTGKEGHGLAINQGHDITVRDSHAYHNTIHGFDVSDMPKGGLLSHDILLERNVSYDNGVTGFSINSDSHHVVFRNNVAMWNGADWAKHGASSGFLCYENCWHVEYYNNVAFQNPDAGFWVQERIEAYPRREDNLLVYKNNITYDNGRGDTLGAGLVVEGTLWQVVASHNNWGGKLGLNTLAVGIHLVKAKSNEIYTRDDVNRGAFGTTNISVAPMFVDMTLGNVRLQRGSPMIDAGTDVGLPFCGSAPDLGAFEVCD